MATVESVEAETSVFPDPDALQGWSQRSSADFWGPGICFVIEFITGLLTCRWWGFIWMWGLK